MIHEDSLGLSIVFRVAIKDIASILAVISVQPPSDCFVDQDVWDALALVLWIIKELFDLLLNVNFLIIIVRLTIHLDISWDLWLVGVVTIGSDRGISDVRELGAVV